MSASGWQAVLVKQPGNRSHKSLCLFWVGRLPSSWLGLPGIGTNRAPQLGAPWSWDCTAVLQNQPGSGVFILAFVCYSLQSCLKEQHFGARFLKRCLVRDSEVVLGCSRCLHEYRMAAPAMRPLTSKHRGQAASPCAVRLRGPPSSPAPGLADPAGPGCWKLTHITFSFFLEAKSHFFL